MPETEFNLDLKELPGKEIIFSIQYRTNLSLETSKKNFKGEPSNYRYESEEIEFASKCQSKIKEITENKETNDKMLIIDPVIKIGQDIQLGALIFNQNKNNWYGLYTKSKNEKAACCFFGDVKIEINGSLGVITCPKKSN